MIAIVNTGIPIIKRKISLQNIKANIPTIVTRAGADIADINKPL